MNLTHVLLLNRGSSLRVEKVYVTALTGKYKVDMTNRFCIICESTKARIGKNGRAEWYLMTEKQFMCSKCRMVGFHRIEGLCKQAGISTSQFI